MIKSCKNSGLLIKSFEVYELWSFFLLFKNISELEFLIQLNDVDDFDQVKKLQQDKIRESTKELNNASIMRKNDLKRQLENAQAKARVDVEKARIRREKAKRIEFRAGIFEL